MKLDRPGALERLQTSTENALTARSRTRFLVHKPRSALSSVLPPAFIPHVPVRCPVTLQLHFESSLLFLKVCDDAFPSKHVSSLTPPFPTDLLPATHPPSLSRDTGGDYCICIGTSPWEHRDWRFTVSKNLSCLSSDVRSSRSWLRRDIVPRVHVQTEDARLRELLCFPTSDPEGTNVHRMCRHRNEMCGRTVPPGRRLSLRRLALTRTGPCPVLNPISVLTSPAVG